MLFFVRFLWPSWVLDWQFMIFSFSIYVQSLIIYFLTSPACFFLGLSTSCFSGSLALLLCLVKYFCLAPVCSCCFCTLVLCSLIILWRVQKKHTDNQVVCCLSNSSWSHIWKGCSLLGPPQAVRPDSGPFLNPHSAFFLKWTFFSGFIFAFYNEWCSHSFVKRQ